MLKHVKLGTDEIFYYNYYGDQLPLRPISSYELDQCFFNSLKFTDEDIAVLVVKLKLRLLDPKVEINVDNKKLSGLFFYYNYVDYWILYFAMKDFQDEEFSKPYPINPKGISIVQKMRDVHKIAKEILSYSYQIKEVVKEIVRTEEGKNLATIVFNLNVPLAEISKITKLQKDFLILSKTKEPNISKTGDKVNIGDILGGLV